MNDQSRSIIDALRREQMVELNELSELDLREISAALADTPESAAFFYALVDAGTLGARTVATDLIRQACDPGVLIEIVRRSTSLASGDEKFVRDLQRAFLDHTGRQELYPGTRAQSLLGALYLSQGRPALLRKLQAHLLEVEHSDDANYLRHVAKVNGLILAHVPDNDLLVVLRDLVNVPEVEDEASFALGLLALSDGLDARDHEAAVEAFHRARDFMAQALAMSEERQDAELYYRCICVLLDFQTGSLHEHLSTMLAEVRENAFGYSATLMPSDRPVDRSSWIGAASIEALRWAELGTRLAALDMSLLKSAWLHAARVIEEELLRVYQASMSIFRRDQAGGIEELVRPRIVGTIQANTFQLAVLDQWLSENKGSLSATAAGAMRDEINVAMEASLHRNSHDAAAASTTAAAIINKVDIPSATAQSAGAALEAAMAALQLQRIEPIATQVFEQLHNELVSNQDYQGHSQEFFIQILYHTLSFVASRESLTHTAVPGIDYLFNRSVDQPPLEADLHKDYFGFLQATPLRELAQREVNDVANGRVDVHFARNGIKTVAELKKTDDDAPLDVLVEKFGLQATAYQRINVTFCILMVLDLVDRGGGSDHLRNLVGVYKRAPDSGKMAYSVVVFRVQGRRKSPSRLN
ncbi:hypothetical protein [Pseudomonas chlororaphis]|uniref:hypothetical protein n=1 Tax=Pseudomonas chlororaphis TaxID=587753 RepID=UPI000F4653CD|nr:hypothetical protein [Pseudomonas chlororaphis]ROL83993.1 hypothetical protein BK637_25605 [Pseudomonas chlororaphis]